MRGMTDFDVYCENVKQDKIDNYDRVKSERDKAIKTIRTLREGFTRLAKMYEGGGVEPFCLQILDHTKEYEDRAIIQQQLQPNKEN